MSAAAAAVRPLRLAEHAAAQHQHIADDADQGHDPDAGRTCPVGGGGGRLGSVGRVNAIGEHVTR